MFIFGEQPKKRSSKHWSAIQYEEDAEVGFLKSREYRSHSGNTQTEQQVGADYRRPEQMTAE